MSPFAVLGVIFGHLFLRNETVCDPWTGIHFRICICSYSAAYGKGVSMIKSAAILDLSPCKFVDEYQLSEELCCLHVEGRFISCNLNLETSLYETLTPVNRTTSCHIPEEFCS
jgi:hypothetical protein